MEELICYCFGYSAADIKADFIRNGRSIVIETIQREKALGNCQCATQNPKGR